MTTVRAARPEDAGAWLRLRCALWPEGCVTSPVAYLEGWYVAPGSRERGIGRALLTAAQDWGRSRGCTEFASDADPDNDVSAAAHLALGFLDVGTVRCFRKEI